jgi:hypothetical protein
MPRVAPTVLVVLALLGVLPSLHAGEEEGASPPEDAPFLGLSVRDTKDGPVVGWIAPGPLGGRGFEAEKTGIRRGDNLVSIDGETVDAAGFEKAVKAKRPGDEVVLVLRRSPDASAESAVPKGGPGGDPFEVRVRLGRRSEWTGTVGRGLGGRTVPPATKGAFETTILEAAAALGEREGMPGVGGGLDALLVRLAAMQEEALDPNALPAVVKTFRRPLSVDAVEAEVDALARPAAGGGVGELAALIRGVLDLPPAGEGAVEEAARRLSEGREVLPQVLALLQTLRDSVYIYDDRADDHVRVLGDRVGPHAADRIRDALVLLRLAPGAWEREATPHAGDAPLENVPANVRAAVPEGDVLWFGTDPLGRLAVVGGKGANRYVMDRVAAVYDVGGDDRYEYPAHDAPLAAPLRLVIDLAGDDRHESAGGFDGPATALMGLSWLDDRAGDDVYTSSGAFSVGAGLLGIGVLLDRGGNDVYECTGEASGWGIGCGFWGVGLVVDGGGSDVYRGEKLVEGVGGPRGLGMILDSGGNDLYVADGPHFGSVYATPAVYVGMSQGFGVGVRAYAAGGLGAIYDLGGNDRYVAGEFSQAGGYYFGIGILHDAAGNDLYHGNRYGQAFAAHQAVGVLVDDAGDDTYWSMTAASQAGTWDESVGLLLDRAGNDAYRADGLAQGGASMQAIALLVDLHGDDRYSGAGGAVQGRGGGNQYHYDADKVFSFSALLDLGGGRDAYSADRENDVARATGAYREKDPAASPLYGLFVDR